MNQIVDENFRELVAEVAAAYFGRSPVDSSEISAVIAQIATSLGAIGPASPVLMADASAQDEREGPEQPKASMSKADVRKSITPEALISFENGKPYRTLRLHLASRGLTPENYRQKWGLPDDYPMVAPGYSAVRSQMAKDFGLGRGPKSRSADVATPRVRAKRSGSKAQAGGRRVRSS